MSFEYRYLEETRGHLDEIFEQLTAQELFDLLLWLSGLGPEKFRECVLANGGDGVAFLAKAPSARPWKKIRASGTLFPVVATAMFLGGKALETMQSHVERGTYPNGGAFREHTRSWAIKAFEWAKTLHPSDREWFRVLPEANNICENMDRECPVRALFEKWNDAWSSRIEAPFFVQAAARGQYTISEAAKILIEEEYGLRMMWAVEQKGDGGITVFPLLDRVAAEKSAEAQGHPLRLVRIKGAWRHDRFVRGRTLAVFDERGVRISGAWA